VHDVSASHRIHGNRDVKTIHVANIIPVDTANSIVEGPLSKRGRGLSGTARALNSGTTVTGVTVDSTLSVRSATCTSPQASRLGARGDRERANATSAQLKSSILGDVGLSEKDTNRNEVAAVVHDSDISATGRAG